MGAILMELPEDKVEASLKQSKVHNFLNDLIELCSKHRVSITAYTLDEGETMVEFHNWDYLTKLEADSEGASLYWPRIQTDIIVRKGK